MDMKLLQNKIESQGISMSLLAERANISRPTLYYRLDHPETWRVNEMVGIIRTLKLPRRDQAEIFGLK